MKLHPFEKEEVWIFINCNWKREERERERENERTVMHGCYFIYFPCTQITVEDFCIKEHYKRISFWDKRKKDIEENEKMSKKT